MPLTLSNLTTSHDDFVAQFQAYVASNPGNFVDFLTTATGQTLTEFVAAIGTYLNAKTTRLLEDNFSGTAQSDSAIYEIVDMLGVRIGRKSPAQLTVTISSPTPFSIPALTQFTGVGSFFFNRAALSIDSTPQTVTLYQGKVIDITANGLNVPFMMFVSPERSFSVSNTDVVVKLNGSVITRLVAAGLWKLKNLPGYQDRTTKDGRLMLIFGNDLYGSKPTAVDVINIKYAVTSGTDGNNLITNGKTLACATSTTIVCTGASNPNGGTNEISALTYKNVAAPNFGTFGAAIIKDQYISNILLYAGVVDVETFSQREVNPSALEWMNVIKVILLTSTVWSGGQKTAFINYIQATSAYSPRLYLEDPVPIVLNVNVNIFCFNSGNTTQARLDAMAAITALFAIQPGLLNRDYFLSDIVEAVMDSNASIEYVTILEPTTDIVVKPQPIAAPTLTVLPGAGTLPVGTYLYSIGYVSTLGGSVAPGAAGAVTITSAQAPAAVRIDWAKAPLATSFQLYGRQHPIGLISNQVPTGLVGATQTFTDTGSIVPSGTAPTQTTVPVGYISLGTLTVTSAFSNRSVR